MTNLKSTYQDIDPFRFFLGFPFSYLFCFSSSIFLLFHFSLSVVRHSFVFHLWKLHFTSSFQVLPSHFSAPKFLMSSNFYYTLTMSSLLISNVLYYPPFVSIMFSFLVPFWILYLEDERQLASRYAHRMYMLGTHTQKNSSWSSLLIRVNVLTVFLSNDILTPYSLHCWPIDLFLLDKINLQIKTKFKITFF